MSTSSALYFSADSVFLNYIGHFWIASQDWGQHSVSCFTSTLSPLFCFLQKVLISRLYLLLDVQTHCFLDVPNNVCQCRCCSLSGVHKKVDLSPSLADHPPTHPPRPTTSKYEILPIRNQNSNEGDKERPNI